MTVSHSQPHRHGAHEALNTVVADDERIRTVVDAENGPRDHVAHHDIVVTWAAHHDHQAGEHEQLLPCRPHSAFRPVHTLVGPPSLPHGWPQQCAASFVASAHDVVNPTGDLSESMPSAQGDPRLSRDGCKAVVMRCALRKLRGQAMMHIRGVTALAVVALVSAIACRAEPGVARHYALTGTVLGIDREKSQLVIQHDDIPGYMSAMIMTFHVADPTAFDQLQGGDQIRADLVVTRSASMLEHITIVRRWRPSTQ